MKQKTIIVTLTIILLLTGVCIQQIVFALTYIQPDTGVTPSKYTFQLTAFNPPTYVNFVSNLYTNASAIYSDHVNFTGVSEGQAITLLQNFGIGIPDGNVSVSNIYYTSTVLSLQCATGSTCHLFYYYTQPLNIYQVFVNQTGNQVTIPNTQYFTSFSSFNSTAAPAIYNNVTGNYLEAKVVYSSPTVLTFYMNTFFLNINLDKTRALTSVAITNTNAANIPETIAIYMCATVNNCGSPVLTTNLVQTAGTQTIPVSSNDKITGQIVEFQVVNWGAATTWQLSQVQVTTIDLNTPVYVASSTVQANVWLILQIASYGLVILGVFFAVPQLKDRLGF